MSLELATRTTPDSTVYLVIYDASGNVWNGTSFVPLVDSNWSTYATVYGTQEGSHSGRYLFAWPTAITNAGAYPVEFFARAGVTPAIPPTDSFVTGGTFRFDGTSVVSSTDTTKLCSIAYAKDILNISTSADDALITDLDIAASSSIEGFCSRNFVIASYAEYYDGPGDIQMMLPRRPVSSLTQVTLDPYGSTPEVINGNAYITAKKTGIIQLKQTSSATSWFAEGFQNIKVEYDAGFDSVPAKVQYVCARLIGRMYRLAKAKRDETIQSETIGKYSVTYRQIANSLLAAADDLKSELTQYRAFIV